LTSEKAQYRHTPFGLQQLATGQYPRLAALDRKQSVLKQASGDKKIEAAIDNSPVNSIRAGSQGDA